ncbi:hypothetical protein [Amycolatopsis thermoflava]|uniref:hypothetical protein n=1 Tax=Amycolatopsis thermoflava TaxID=84480 RepID=UPI000429A3FD|nr:hypothetical protein [Amycolatopsis thermoflava]
MSDLIDNAAQLDQLAATALPFTLIEQLDAELVGVASQVAAIVADTGKADLVDTIHGTRTELTQHLHDQLQKLAGELQTTAQRIRT